MLPVAAEIRCKLRTGIWPLTGSKLKAAILAVTIGRGFVDDAVHRRAVAIPVDLCLILVLDEGALKLHRISRLAKVPRIAGGC